MIKDLSKPTEIERSIQIVGRGLFSLEESVSKPRSLPLLLAHREEAVALSGTANNLTFCLAFNELENTARAKLTEVALQTRVAELNRRCGDTIRTVESAISQSVKSKLQSAKLERAAAVCQSLYAEHQLDVSWSAMNTGKKIEPVLHVRADNVKDQSGFEHASYHIWVRPSEAGKSQMNTGFNISPPVNGWEDCASDRELQARIKQRLIEDGF